MINLIFHHLIFINFINIYQMEQYTTFTQLIGLRNQNLSPYRDARVKRLQSVERMMNLIEIAKSTKPRLPIRAIQLDPYDPQWDDLMPFPYIDFDRYAKYAASMVGLVAFYGYNYNTITYNIRFRAVRMLFPFLLGSIFVSGYYGYRQQILKTNLFDEYCYLRSQELVKQNEYLLKHEDVQRVVWWNEDFKETLSKIYRQGNDNAASDFADSELLLQDFINRYVDPNAESPMKPFTARSVVPADVVS